jgi:hypothetical protein
MQSQTFEIEKRANISNTRDPLSLQQSSMITPLIPLSSMPALVSSNAAMISTSLSQPLSSSSSSTQLALFEGRIPKVENGRHPLTPPTAIPFDHIPPFACSSLVPTPSTSSTSSSHVSSSSTIMIANSVGWYPSSVAEVGGKSNTIRVPVAVPVVASERMTPLPSSTSMSVDKVGLNESISKAHWESVPSVVPIDVCEILRYSKFRALSSSPTTTTSLPTINAPSSLSPTSALSSSPMKGGETKEVKQRPLGNSRSGGMKMTRLPITSAPGRAFDSATPETQKVRL